MELNELHDNLISEGCNRFYIDGIGGPQSDDVERLGLTNGNWEVYYIERGKRSVAFFSTTDKDEAISFYYDYVMKIEHWHIVVFSRSIEIFNYYKKELEQYGIRTIQNDIPAYQRSGDHVYRLFVTNKDIFTAKEKLENIPYIDENLKR